MKKILATIFTLLLLSTAMQASETADATLFAKNHQTDNYSIKIYSEKSLATGDNTFEVLLKQAGVIVTDAKVKVRFFMPEMPGMPAMEYKEKFKFDNRTNSYKGVVNFGMSGTWQYQLKFKTADGSIHKIRGSVNL